MPTGIIIGAYHLQGTRVLDAWRQFVAFSPRGRFVPATVGALRVVLRFSPVYFPALHPQTGSLNIPYPRRTKLREFTRWFAGCFRSVDIELSKVG
jgi:hypothetical protein